jgi:hypothetical protein
MDTGRAAVPESRIQMVPGSIPSILYQILIQYDIYKNCDCLLGPIGSIPRFCPGAVSDEICGADTFLKRGLFIRGLSVLTAAKRARTLHSAQAGRCTANQSQ